MLANNLLFNYPLSSLHKVHEKCEYLLEASAMPKKIPRAQPCSENIQILNLWFIYHIDIVLAARTVYNLI